MRSRTGLVALLLLASGACALVYQAAWLREMRLVFGMSTSASAAVLAIFMGGLGLGGLFLGRLADRHPRPLALYGKLELAVSAAAALTPLLITVARHAYLAAGGTPALGLGLGTVARLALATLVLGLPTVLMGGTLPAAIRAVESEDDLGRRRLALLYGINTLGALAGTALATFLLLELLGIRAMLWSAAAVNALVGLAALLLSKMGTAPDFGSVDRMPVQGLLAASIETGTSASDALVSGKSGAVPNFSREGEIGKSGAVPISRAFVLAAAFGVGFAFLLMELVWYRMLAPILGGSSYTFGLILSVALLGIGLGGAAASAAREARPATLGGFALTCSLEALFLGIPLALGDRLALLALQLRELNALGFGGQVAAWALVAGIVVLPAAFVAGVQFPLLVGLLGRGRHGVGQDTGAAYAWNTLGSIVGSLAGGFGLLPLLTAPGAWRLAAGLLAVLGIVASGLALFRRRSGVAGAVAAPLAAGVALVLLAAPGPTAAWRHSGIGAGRAALPSPTSNGVNEWVNSRRRAIRWEADGVESAIALSAADGYAFLVAGKSDGSARGDAPTQVMGGLVGAMLHPDPRAAFVVGLGTGSTAGWLAAVPSIDRVDVAELEPAILEIARFCEPVNQGVLDNPKVRMFLGDAREQLLASDQAYDVIFSEPSNPYRAGISSLFTVEFYEAARDRLTDRGLFLQWLQAYEVDAATVRTVYATLGHVFPSVETWATKNGDLLLVASRAVPDHDPARLAARAAREPYRSAMLAAWRVEGAEGLLAHFVARDDVTRTVAAAEGDALNTDDRNRVEFGFARSVGQRHGFDVAELRAFARTKGWHRPAVEGPPPDWERVDDARLESGLAEGDPVDPDEVEGPRKHRAEAFLAFHRDDLAGALASWQGQPAAPGTPVALAVVAEARAEAADGTAEALADRLRAWQPAEADLVMARLRHRQNRPTEAAGYLEAAFARLRTDPWPLPVMVSRGLSLAAQVGTGRADLARRLRDALAEPFVLSIQDEERRLQAVALSALASEAEGPNCTPWFGALEPHVPWRLSFLMARAKCHAAAEDPGVVGSVSDLEAFLGAEPARFAAGL